MHYVHDIKEIIHRFICTNLYLHHLETDMEPVLGSGDKAGFHHNRVGPYYL